MRDDDDRAVELGDERLEPREPGEVEVVRRLVEQQHVEAAEQDRRERGARGLAAGEPGELAVESRAESELREHSGRPRFEVAAPAGEERIERVVVCRGELRLGAEPRGEAVHPFRSRRHAGATREIREQRLAVERVALLRQVADGERRRVAPDGSAIRLVLAGEQPEQRRLPRAVRPDEPDPRVRRHDEVDAGENDVGSVRLRDAGRGESADRAHTHLLTRTCRSGLKATRAAGTRSWALVSPS